MDWTPVDYVARAIVRISIVDNGSAAGHVNPEPSEASGAEKDSEKKIRVYHMNNHKGLNSGSLLVLANCLRESVFFFRVEMERFFGEGKRNKPGVQKYYFGAWSRGQIRQRVKMFPFSLGFSAGYQIKPVTFPVWKKKLEETPDCSLTPLLGYFEKGFPVEFSFSCERTKTTLESTWKEEETSDSSLEKKYPFTCPYMGESDTLIRRIVSFLERKGLVHK
jgi:hypothetical protein